MLTLYLTACTMQASVGGITLHPICYWLASPYRSISGGRFSGHPWSDASLWRPPGYLTACLQVLIAVNHSQGLLVVVGGGGVLLYTVKTACIYTVKHCQKLRYLKPLASRRRPPISSLQVIFFDTLYTICIKIAGFSLYLITLITLAKCKLF